MEMIDIHCHILSGVDDGARSLETSIRMAKKAKRLGYTDIFATPHYIEFDLENEKKEITQRVKELNEILEDNGIAIKVHIGNEIYISSNIASRLEKKEICTLGDSKYVLIELPMQGRVQNLIEIVKELISKEYIPILAHPERYEFVYKDYTLLYDLIDLGVLMQLNIGSIVGIYGRKAKNMAKKLLKNNMVHLMATDSHDSTSIYDMYDKAMRKITKIIPEKKYYEIMYMNPSEIKDSFDNFKFNF